MRFKITLKRTSRENQIPASYAYELHSALLKILHKADEQYADFIHNIGHQVPESRKSFKLFCFSQLFMQPFQMDRGCITIKSNTVSFHLSFYVDTTAEKFILGLFQDQHIRLGNRTYQTDFRVENVEVVALPTLSETMRYKILSPIFVSKKNAGTTDTYLSPQDADYTDFLKANLIDKYLSVHQTLPEWQNAPFEIEILGGEQANKKLITIKEGKDAKTQVKGYHKFQVQVTAPPEIHEIVLLTGLGSKNSMGFGYMEEVEMVR